MILFPMSEMASFRTSATIQITHVFKICKIKYALIYKAEVLLTT